MVTKMARAKKRRRRYLRERRGRSSQRGGVRARPKRRLPTEASISERVPTGQAHEQNAFFRRTPIERTRTRITTPAG
jgi:hypothetical protein